MTLMLKCIHSPTF